MKKLSCVLLSAVILISITACSGAESKQLYAGYCEFYDDGGLMAFDECSYEFNKDGNPVKECEYINGRLVSTKKYKYDSSGTYTESEYDSRGELEISREYNENSVLIKETYYDNDEEVEKISEYNDEGLIIREESFDWWHYIVEYEYDGSGNLLKEKETDFDDNDEVEKYYESIYDSEGDVILRTVTTPDGSSVVDTRLEKETNEEGSKITVKNYGLDDELKYLTEKEYDENGNLLKEVTYVVRDDEVLISNEYAYDEEDRVIDYIQESSLGRTETKYEYSEEGYMCKESIITERMVYAEVFSDGSDGHLAECITVKIYNADGVQTREEYWVGGKRSSYTEYYYEDVKVKHGSKSTFDFRDESRRLDNRATAVY
ncbi:MAG: hypothetical protein IKS60_07640 [Lachnospiraceae bacterium]|nr:hypothetical protein [Lachnospiraceae bacterium]